MDVVQQSQDLLKTIREVVLKVTWPDPKRDESILRDIQAGMVYIQSLVPKEAALDFTEPTLERILLDNYVLYAQSNALDDFRENYSEDIGDFKRFMEVSIYERQSEAKDV